MPIFKVNVDRIGYATREIEVEAPSQEEANLKALDTAGNFEYSEHTSEYFLSDEETKGQTAIRLLRELHNEIGRRADDGDQGMADLDNCEPILEARKKLNIHKG